METLERVRVLLNPDSVVHENGKCGSAYLGELSDAKLSSVFMAVVVQKEQPSKIAQDLEKAAKRKGVTVEQLLAALRRLSLVGMPLAAELAPQQKEEPPIPPVIGLKVSPGASLAEHLKNAARAPKDLDAVSKMSGLCVLLEEQLVHLYGHPTRSMNPFMMVSQVNQSASILMNGLEKLNRMQADAGIIVRRPEEVELTVQMNGAFQTYIGELDNGAKEQMQEFAASFRNFVKKRKERG